MTRKYYGDEGRHVEKLNQHLVKSKARSLLKLQAETKKNETFEKHDVIWDRYLKLWFPSNAKTNLNQTFLQHLLAMILLGSISVLIFHVLCGQVKGGYSKDRENQKVKSVLFTKNYQVTYKRLK